MLPHIYIYIYIYIYILDYVQQIGNNLSAAIEVILYKRYPCDYLSELGEGLKYHTEELVLQVCLRDTDVIKLVRQIGYRMSSLISVKTFTTFV